MIKIIFIVTLLFVYTLKAIGQGYEPTILILFPYETTADESLKKEIQKYNSQLKRNRKYAVKETEQYLKEIEDRAENIKIMYNKKVEFLENMTFYSIIPLIAADYLQYRFFEGFENHMIYAINEKSDGNINTLSSIAKGRKMQYVVNFPKVNSCLENGSKRTTITVQLFDSNQEKIVIEKEFKGDDRNPGFEFSCEDSTLMCTINNSLSQALDEIIGIIISRNPTILGIKHLTQEREEVLFSIYYPKKPENEIIKIIENNEQNISTKEFYHGFMDDSKSKFIGFFALYNQVTNQQELNDKNDESVHFIHDDLNYFENIPKIYAYVVVAINYDSIWYFKKDEVTYFNSDDFETGKMEFFNNLQRWNFFKENTTEFNPDFWESYFFEKIEDLTKDPEWNRYGESIWEKEERMNRPYIGMYKIVADQMRNDLSEEADKFKTEVSKYILQPFLEELIYENSDEFFEYILMNKKFTLIFPKDRSVVLNPIQIINSKDKRQLMYFVIFPETEEIFEWKYFKPRKLKDNSWHYGLEIIEQLSTITKWDFSYGNLDDENFWDNCVLKKEGDNFTYLIKSN
ncbi:MAG: hypothetical protein K8R37_01435 [Bacteroidales bacterium]|nr:hypothetical protein [Bacteroidales bacterium]